MKKFIASILILCVALLVANIGMTVAFFSGATYLEYNNIQIGLSDKNIEISTDNVNWGTSIGEGDLENIENLRPVSSMYSYTWLNSKKEKPEFRSGYKTANTQFVNKESDATIATNGFFSKPIYLRADSDIYLTIDKENTYFAANEEKNRQSIKDNDLLYKYPDLTERQILDNLNSIEKSLRMSILVLNSGNSSLLKDYAYYIIEPYKDRDTLFGGRLDNDESHYYDTYGDYEAVYGDIKNEDKVIYDDPTQYETPVEGEYSIFNAKSHSDVYRFNLDKSIENGMEVAKENSIAVEEAENSVYIPLYENEPRKLYISFYLEGWDLDNTNITMFAYFTINISFMIANSRA